MLGRMSAPRTGAERYFAERRQEPGYDDAYQRARRRIAAIDAVIGALETRRQDLGLTKADLARLAGMKPESVRRLLSSERPNPTLGTLVALSDALDIELTPSARPTATPADGPGTRRRSA
jgi:DNA-binding phage protein